MESSKADGQTLDLVRTLLFFTLCLYSLHTPIIGQLESTMTIKFCQGANLLGLLADQKLPSFLSSIVSQVQHFVSSRAAYGGTLLDEVAGPLGWSLAGSESSSQAGLSLAEREALRQEGLGKARVCSKLVRDGLEEYESINTSAGNSSVSYFSNRLGRTTTGRISQVVRKGESSNVSDVYLLVRSFRSLSEYDEHRDPFRRYPEFQAQLFHTNLSPQLEIIPVQHLLGHVALCPFDGRLGRQSMEPCLISISLSRVRAPRLCQDESFF